MDYAPPFSTTKDPVMYAGMILDNVINKGKPLIKAQALETLIQPCEKCELIDARAATQHEKDYVETADNIPHAKLRDIAQRMDKDAVTVTYCNKGVSGNVAQNILINKGFKEVYNLSGGYKQFSKIHSKDNK